MTKWRPPISSFTPHRTAPPALEVDSGVFTTAAEQEFGLTRAQGRGANPPSGLESSPFDENPSRSQNASRNDAFASFRGETIATTFIVVYIFQILVGGVCETKSCTHIRHFEQVFLFAHSYHWLPLSHFRTPSHLLQIPALPPTRPTWSPPQWTSVAMGASRCLIC